MFFLTLDELLADPRVDCRDIVAERRALYTRYKSLDLPPAWQGNPAPVPLDGGDQLAERVDIVSGMGVSPGIAEGTVRVVQDADSDQADDFEPGDILVCRITDPSWAPLLSVAAAVVIDIGGRCPMAPSLLVNSESLVSSILWTAAAGCAPATG